MSAKQLLQPLIKKPLFLGIKTTCPFCKNALALTKSKGVTPEIIEVNTREDGPEIWKTLTDMTGQKTVPFVYSFGKFIGGSTDLKKQPDSFWEAIKKAQS